jgi:hypothetical protein
LPTKTKHERFDVAIIDVHTGRIDAVIGRDLDQKGADKRLLTGLGRINGNYFVDIFPAGQYKVGDTRGGR